MCSATAPTVPLESRSIPVINVDLDLVGVGKITFCQEINAELWQQNDVNVIGAEEDDDELDSHEPLMLSKLSALLCLLEGRKAVTLDDWALAKSCTPPRAAVMDDLAGVRQRATAEQSRRARRCSRRLVRPGPTSPRRTLTAMSPGSTQWI